MLNESFHEQPRRQFLKRTGQGLIAAGLAAESAPQIFAQAGQQRGGQSSAPPINFPPIEAPTEQQKAPPPAPLAPAKRVGFAGVGLGRLSLDELLPPFDRRPPARRHSERTL